ncbi:Impact family member yigz [Thalictrum thalictroides]|uniref:Impact family member yigz n=1 Tax=Thalictrum thalictroides TaxID=46969 RepID=A0A7J6X181_THATH|nr:Impact family member yigz [Thalictrum thalictroides]
MQMTVKLLITPPSPQHSLFFNFFKSKQPVLRLRVPSPFFFFFIPSSSSPFKKRTMVTSTSLANNNISDSSSSSYTTITETVTFEREIKKSKFIAIAGSITDDQSAHSFLSQVKDSRATHNCWAYKVGDQYRSNDDGEPSGTAGKPIYTAIASSGIDRVIVVVIRYFGGIKLGTGGLVRAYGGVASECLKNATTCLVKSKISIAIEVPYDLLGVMYHQIQTFQVEDIMQDYDTGKEGITIVSFKVDYDKVKSLEDAIKTNCSRQIVFVKQ